VVNGGRLRCHGSPIANNWVLARVGFRVSGLVGVGVVKFCVLLGGCVLLCVGCVIWLFFGVFVCFVDEFRKREGESAVSVAK